MLVRIPRRLRQVPSPGPVGLTLVAAALLLAALGPALVHGQTFVPPPPGAVLGTVTPGSAGSANTISATGQGSASLPPDKALVSASVQTRATAASDALDQNSRTVQAVLAAVKGLGVSDADIQTTQLTLYPVYPPPASCNQGQTTLPNGAVFVSATPCSEPTSPPTVSYFQVTEGIGVTTTDLSTVSDLVEAMVGAGITQFSGIQFGWQNPEQLRQMAIQAASADAQQEAQTLAASLRVALGPVITSSLLSSSAPPVPALQVPQIGFGASGPILAPPLAVPPPIQPGQQTATANVSVTFAIAGR